MRYVNEQMQDIRFEDIDLSHGYLIDVTLVRRDAEPIDNLTKFAWEIADYEGGKMFIPFIPEGTSIDDVRAQKLRQMSKACRETIIGGIDVDLDGQTYHFSLTDDDQRNLLASQVEIMAGKTEVPYHADGEPCIMYSAEDFMKIATAATRWITYHESYYNSLKIYINALTDMYQIYNIAYGDEIPEQYQTDVLKGLIAGGQTV